jgi:hypothetical protein
VLATVQPRARREAGLMVVEALCVLPLWAASTSKDMRLTTWMWTTAAALEILMAVLEPVQRAHDHLHSRGVLRSALERVPVNPCFTEKRWHRLLMIALAMLPAASVAGYARKYEPVFFVRPRRSNCLSHCAASHRSIASSRDVCRLQVYLICTPCLLAYAIKLQRHSIAWPYHRPGVRDQAVTSHGRTSSRCACAALASAVLCVIGAAHGHRRRLSLQVLL